VALELVEVGLERGLQGDGVHGDQRFVLDAGEEAALGGGGDEGVEGIVEVLGGLEGVSRLPLVIVLGAYRPEIPDCMIATEYEFLDSYMCTRLWGLGAELGLGSDTSLLDVDSRLLATISMLPLTYRQNDHLSLY